jgi:predicted DNA-binding transcriptional regulator AlpA
MKTCNTVKNTQSNGISSESLKSSKGQSVMPDAHHINAIRADDLTLVDNNQAADIIGVNSRTLMNWRSLGKSPRYVKCGRNVRYRVSDLKAWLDAQTRNHTGDVA